MTIGQVISSLCPADIQIHVDGKNVPPVLVYPLYQEDPFPGDMHYQLVIRTDHAINLFPYLMDRGDSDYTRIQVERALTTIGQILPGVFGEAERVEYFLNGINSFAVEHGLVRISGVCSTVIRAA